MRKNGKNAGTRLPRRATAPLAIPPVPGVVFAPDSRRGLRAGLNVLANAIRPTLGPLSRTVVISRIVSTSQPPEVLADGGTIARRLIELDHRDADMGAMLLRQALWKIQETVGDGTATTAVLCQAVVREGERQLAAGASAIELREGLLWATERVVEALRRQARPIEGQAALTAYALSIGDDRELAGMIGEILDIVGAEGYVQVRERHRRELEREYIEGSYWRGSWLSRELVTDTVSGEATLDDAAVVLTNLAIETVDEIVPLLELVRQQDYSGLFLIARDIREAALPVLLANYQAGTVKVLAAKLSALGADLDDELADIGVLTGATPLYEAAGARLSRITPDQIGRSRRAWATSAYVGLAGGGGDPHARRRQIRMLRQRLTTLDTLEAREPVQERIGRLLGGMAMLHVGGNTESEREARRTVAERTVAAVRLALARGVVPGGGSSFVRAADGLRASMPPAGHAAGVATLIRALEEPLRVISANAGYEPPVVVSQVRNAPEGHGWDARTGAVVDLWAAGIVDPVEQLTAVLQTAVRTAALLLATDVLVHHAQREDATTP